MGDRKQPTPVPSDQVKPEPPPTPPSVRADMRSAFAAAFEKWLTEYQADPAKFQSLDALNGAPKTYGEQSADMLIRYLNELSSGKPWNLIGS